MNSAILSRIIALFFAVAMIATVGCDDNAARQQSVATNKQKSVFNVTEINGFGFMFNDTEEGGMINFKSDEISHCSLVFVKSKFIQGYNTRITTLGQGEIDLTCLTDKYHYAMTDNGSTYVQLAVEKLGDEAVLKLDFSLYSVRKKNMLTKENIMLVVNKAQLKTLFANK